MNTDNRPFDRREAFDIFARYIEWGDDRLHLAGHAINAARDFQEAVAGANAPLDRKHPITALRKFGQFVPSGLSLYFLSSDGLNVLLAEFKNTIEPVLIAQAFNEVFPTVNADYDPTFLKQVEAAIASRSGEEVDE